jgi:capsular exopolysaccharide synthesis family protein
LIVELRTIVRLLREHWLSIVLLCLLGAATATVMVVRQTPQYAASTTLYVFSREDQTTAAAAYQGSLLSQQEATTYAHLVVSKRVLGQVAGKLGDSETPEHLAHRVSVTVVPQTALLTITATDITGAGAQKTANAVAESFVSVVPSLTGSTDATTATNASVVVSVVSDASLPTSPFAPKPALTIGLGALAGLLIGVALAAARHTLDQSVKSMEQAQQIAGAPALGTVPVDQTAARSPLAVHQDAQRGRAEALRKIAASLRFVDLENQHTVILVTSAASQEGKTITACNLALTLARSGRRVIIIDGDLRRPQVAGYLGLPAGIGLTSVLVGSARLAEATQAWADNLFSVLACGPIPPNPAEMLGSQRMRDLLAKLREEYDDVILDAAPVLPVADAAVAATGCDGVIVVARHGKTRRDQLQQAVSTMRATQTPILGVVLNRVPNRGKKREYYYAPRPGSQSTVPREGRFVTREAANR